MRTVVLLSMRGFGIFRFDLLKRPEEVRFVGICSEHDIANVAEDRRARFAEIHVVPCPVTDPSPLMSTLLDPEATRAALTGVLAGLDPDDVSLLCYDEVNLLLAAQLREEAGLAGPRYDDILPFRDKLVMKERLLAGGVRVPAFGRFDPAEFAASPTAYFHRIVAEVGLPFILKPVDAAGADGVHKVTSVAEFTDLPGEFGRDYEYEEFVTGTVYSVNLVSKDRRTVFGGVTEYLATAFDVQFGRVNADINLIDDDPRVARMVRFAEQALDALVWPDGASHLELFLTPDDELVFLEVAARFKGMAGLAAMQRHYGIALVNLSFELETGLESLPYDGEQIYCFDGVIPKEQGVVERLVEPELESQVEMAWAVRPGEEIARTRSLLANGGTFLVSNADFAALYRDFQRLAGYRPIVYRDQPVLATTP